MIGPLDFLHNNVAYIARVVYCRLSLIAAAACIAITIGTGNFPYESILTASIVIIQIHWRDCLNFLAFNAMHAMMILMRTVIVIMMI